MTTARIKNWADFQHYGRRNPPWVKLHGKLLDDRNFLRLPVEARALLPMLWLLAREAKEMDGTVDIDVDQLNFRLRLPERELIAGLKPLIDGGWLELQAGDLFSAASTLLASGLQGATPETETETDQRSLRSVRSADRFEEFWKLYPVRVAKTKAKAAWKRKNLDKHADLIVTNITARLKNDKKWSEGYIPHPTTFLNQERWLDEAATPVGAQARSTAGSSPKVEETPQTRFEALKSFLAQQIEMGYTTREAARSECIKFKAKHGLP
jgi:hypothetical protein